MSWAEHVAQLEKEKRHMKLVGKTEGKRPLGGNLALL
jgi:hypothetical protein